jgi:nucleotide-binding universal stress UspA family protein
VPHDGSEMSDKALNKAIELAKAFKSEIVILHIIDDRLMPTDAMLGFITQRSSFTDAKTQLLKVLKIGAEAMLKDRMEKVKKNKIDVRFIMGIGSPPERIADIAKSEKLI